MAYTKCLLKQENTTVTFLAHRLGDQNYRIVEARTERFTFYLLTACERARLHVDILLRCVKVKNGEFKCKYIQLLSR